MVFFLLLVLRCGIPSQQHSRNYGSSEKSLDQCTKNQGTTPAFLNSLTGHFTVTPQDDTQTTEEESLSSTE